MKKESDQAAHEAGIQAEQPKVVEELIEAGAQPYVAAAVQHPMTSYQVLPPETFNFKPEEWSR